MRIEALEGLKQHQKNAINLMKAGQISKAQKMKVDVSVNEAERELAKAERDVKIALKVLASHLNRSEDEYTLTTALAMPSVPSLPDFNKTAEGQSPVLKQIQHKRELLNAKKTVVQSEFLPTVAAFGKYELYKNDLTTLEPEWAVGVALRMNIFNGGADKNELNAVKKDQIVLDNLDRNAHDLVKIGLEKIYSDLMSAKEQHQSLLKSQELALESLRLNSNAFANGFNKSTDVIDSQVTLASVKLALQKSLYDYNNSLAQLFIVSGQSEKLLEIYSEK